VSLVYTAQVSCQGVWRKNLISFSARLVELRKNMNWTQQELADKLDMHVRMIQRYESGKIASPENLVKIADYFHISLDYLVGRSDDPSWGNEPKRGERLPDNKE
jgi:transcriptional regulator with XRE-family HTH domain